MKASKKKLLQASLVVKSYAFKSQCHLDKYSYKCQQWIFITDYKSKESYIKIVKHSYFHLQSFTHRVR